MTFFRTLALATLLLSTPSLANDSEAEWAVGGLVLKPNEHISMDSEDLYISAEQVRVTYRYTNHSDSDQSVLISFPLPAIPGDDDWFEYANYPDWSRLGFSTTVDGEAVEWQTVDRALIGGKDVTAEVIAEGLPINWYADGDIFEQLSDLPDSEKRRLSDAGLIRLTDGIGLAPAWNAQRHIVRRQTFPAGKSVTVKHSYAPIIGGSVGGMLYPTARKDMPDALAEYRERWCLDNSFLAGVDRKLAAHGPDEIVYYAETWLGYVLSSGANWRGPIKNFRLVVDKGSPDNLVSFCMNDVRKISPTQFEVVKRNYEPSGDLNILITEFHKVEN